MANALYDKGRQGFLDGDISWSGDNIKVTLIDMNDYPTKDITSDTFYSVIPVAARVAESDNLASKDSSNGVADADDVVFQSVSGDQAEALVIWKDTGNEASSPLIAFIDVATGLPVTPNNGDITVQWDNGANKIFKL